ncbi:hypothetical protein ACFL5V_08575 [Fibrobacterota bacterium]
MRWQTDRRTFLQSAAAAVAAVTGRCVSPSSAPDTKAFPVDLVLQNNMVNPDEVDKSMAAMAMALTQADTEAGAWQTIFQTGGKPWSEIRAAIKFNEIGPNIPRTAVLGKLCHVLVNLGMSAGNITIYGSHHAGLASLESYFSLLQGLLPAGCVLSNFDIELGGMVSVSIPTAVKNEIQITQCDCIKDIAEHNLDILINIGANKGHWEEFGSFTLTMKNHFGTFSPTPYPGAAFDDSHANFSYLLAVNRSDVLIGGTVPLQQLCLVDSLWAGSRPSPGAEGDDVPVNRLIMGTFSPAVDYLTALKIRRDLMGCDVGENVYELLPAFGYAEADFGQLGFVTVDTLDPLSYIGNTTASPPHIQQINPFIDNLRVVCCHNEKIVTLEA